MSADIRCYLAQTGTTAARRVERADRDPPEDRCIELRRAGHTYAQIAQETGRAASTIAQAPRGHVPAVHDVKAARAEEYRSEIREAMEHLTLADIAAVCEEIAGPAVEAS